MPVEKTVRPCAGKSERWLIQVLLVCVSLAGAKCGHALHMIVIISYGPGFLNYPCTKISVFVTLHTYSLPFIIP